MQVDESHIRLPESVTVEDGTVYLPDDQTDDVQARIIEEGHFHSHEKDSDIYRECDVLLDASALGRPDVAEHITSDGHLNWRDLTGRARKAVLEWFGEEEIEIVEPAS